MQNRSREALQVLDRVASRFPDDGELQASYAHALLGRAGREAEAFSAWSQAWNTLSNSGASPNNAALLKALPAPERLRYRRLAEGFDITIGNATKSLYSLSERVLDSSLSREDANAQARAPLSQVLNAYNAIKALQPPDDRLRESHLARVEAGDKLLQAASAYTLFLESGDDNLRDRATELHKAAVAQINALRNEG